MESIAYRKTALTEWLAAECGLRSFSMQALPGDASFRRYYRVISHNNEYIAMDAPPPTENCGPFVDIAQALRNIKLQAPEIIGKNLDQGFLLLSDFGDDTYLKVLNDDNADLLYKRALESLAILQQCPSIPNRPIPPFTREFMWQEWAWHQEWFLQKFLGLKTDDTLNANYHLLVESACEQPQVFMHRDFHSGNLMRLPDNQVGILDFQDAFIGPVTYDLASLLRDCYIDWPASDVRRWALYYFQLLKSRHQLSGVDEATFLRWLDWMGIQRHLKALLTFARKAVRDHQPSYLAHIPRTLNYLLSVSSNYAELKVLHDYLQQIVQPTFKKVISCER